MILALGNAHNYNNTEAKNRRHYFPIKIEEMIKSYYIHAVHEMLNLLGTNEL